jgi:hypothetical protein
MRMDGLPARRLFRLIVVLLLGIVLTACGGDEGDNEPTATSAPGGAQPTVAVGKSESPAAGSDVSSASSPSNTDMSDVPASLTPGSASSTGTPSVLASAVADATPTGAEPGGASPVAAAATEPAGRATPSTGDKHKEISASATPGTETTTTEGGAAVGDGTTGAVIAATPDATPPGPMASPGASPVAASPAAAVTVRGCEVTNVPQFTGEQTIFVLTSDVNFRTGPGADCDLALDTPLGEFQQVEVIGGPVIREDDGSEWVQIRVLDTEGWVAFEFLQPAG